MLMKIERKDFRVESPSDLVAVVRRVFCAEAPFDQDKQLVFAVGLDSRDKVRYVDLVAVGTVDEVQLHPREAFRRAIQSGASRLALVQNHPSGEVESTHAERKVVRRMIAAGKVVGIAIADHIIIRSEDGEYASAKEEHPGLWLD